MIHLEQKFARTCIYAAIIVALAIGVVATATNNNFVAADPCYAQIGSPTTATQQYYGSNFLLTVPISATCSIYAGQLYATGTAYDTTFNSNVGTANTILSTTYGSNAFGGQLQFNLPASAASHSVQFFVSIYGQTGYYQPYGYGGSALTTTSATFVVNPPYQYGYQNYPYYSNYQNNPYYSNYQNYPTYPTYPNYPNYQAPYQSPGYPYNYPGNNYYYHPYPYYFPYGGYYYYYRYGWGYNNHYCPRSNNYCNGHH